MTVSYKTAHGPATQPSGAPDRQPQNCCPGIACKRLSLRVDPRPDHRLPAAPVRPPRPALPALAIRHPPAAPPASRDPPRRAPASPGPTPRAHSPPAPPRTHTARLRAQRTHPAVTLRPRPDPYPTPTRLSPIRAPVTSATPDRPRPAYRHPAEKMPQMHLAQARHNYYDNKTIIEPPPVAPRPPAPPPPDRSPPPQ